MREGFGPSLLKAWDLEKFNIAGWIPGVCKICIYIYIGEYLQVRSVREMKY